MAGVVLNRVGSEYHAAAPARGARAARRRRARRPDPRRRARGARAPPRPRAGDRARGPGTRGDRAAGRGGRRAVRPRRSLCAWPAPPARSRRPRGRRKGRRAAPRSRSPAAAPSRSTTRRTSSCCALRAPSCAEFDPLTDADLPDGAGALMLAGGFPEVFGEELSANAPLRAASPPSRAPEGRSWPSAAACSTWPTSSTAGRCAACSDGAAAMGERLSLGYREAVAVADHPVWPAGTEVRGHEFHYSQVEPRAGDPPAWRLRAYGGERAEGHVAGGVHASYLHTHWAATPQVASGSSRRPRCGKLWPSDEGTADRCRRGSGRPRAPDAQGAARAARGRPRVRPRGRPRARRSSPST